MGLAKRGARRTKMTLTHCLSRVGRSIGSAAAFVTVAVLLPSIPEHSIRAQMLPAADAAILDPYTRGKEDRLADLGYVSLGPLQLTSNHDSDDVQRLLGDERLRWIETRHFRIGFALGAADATGSPVFVQDLRQDLAQLRQRLPAVDPRTKVLDAWLRAHLVALRAERVYADALEVLRRSQDDFASAGRDPRADATFAGLGPHFGMQQKFTILLLGKQTSLAKYTAAFHGGATTAAVRRHDASFGNLVFAVAGDSVPGLGENEEVLAATMAFHVAHNLYAGYRSFGHLLPAWIPEGLALHHARRVSDTAAVVDVRNDADRAAYAAWPQCLVDAKKQWRFQPLVDFVRIVDGSPRSMEQSRQSWAFVDWLLRERGDEFAAFVHRMKDPFHDRLRFPTVEELRARQARLFVEAFGCGVDELEAGWRRAIASKNAPKKRR
jgi:hypothetical protein